MVSATKKMLLVPAALFVSSVAIALIVRPFSVELSLFLLVVAFASLLAAFALALVYVLPRPTEDADVY